MMVPRKDIMRIIRWAQGFQCSWSLAELQVPVWRPKRRA